MACSVRDVAFILDLSELVRGRSLGDAFDLTTSVKKVFNSPGIPNVKPTGILLTRLVS